MVRPGRIELPLLGYQPSLLPLKYERMDLPARVELASSRWQRDVWPTHRGRWLPGHESNVIRRVQSSSCYRYTTGQWCAHEESNPLFRKGHQFYKLRQIPLCSGRKNWWTPRESNPSKVCLQNRLGTLPVDARRLVDPPGFEPGTSQCHCDMIPFHHGPMVDDPGSAPGSSRLQRDAFTRLACRPGSPDGCRARYSCSTDRCDSRFTTRPWHTAEGLSLAGRFWRPS